MNFLQVLLVFGCFTSYLCNLYSLDGTCGEENVYCDVAYTDAGIYYFNKLNTKLERLEFDRFAESFLNITNAQALEAFIIKYSSGVSTDACKILIGDSKICIKIVLLDRTEHVEHPSCCVQTTSTDKPAYKVSTDNPAHGSSTDKPAYVVSTDVPAHGSSAGVSTDSPAHGSSTDKPAYGGSTDNPAHGSSSGKPAYVSSTDEAAYGSSDNPNDGSSTEPNSHSTQDTSQGNTFTVKTTNYSKDETVLCSSTVKTYTTDDTILYKSFATEPSGSQSKFDILWKCIAIVACTIIFISISLFIFLKVKRSRYHKRQNVTTRLSLESGDSVVEYEMREQCTGSEITSF